MLITEMYRHNVFGTIGVVFLGGEAYFVGYEIHRIFKKSGVSNTFIRKSIPEKFLVVDVVKHRGLNRYTILISLRGLLNFLENTDLCTQPVKDYFMCWLGAMGFLNNVPKIKNSYKKRGMAYDIIFQ